MTTTTKNNGWRIIGKTEGGICQHCTRTLKNCYTITHTSGDTMTVGRGCLKTVTGWTVTQKEADRLVWLAERAIVRDANWSAFAAKHPDAAGVIDAEIEQGGRYAQYASTVKLDISEGDVVGWELEHAWGLLKDIAAYYG